MVRNALNMSQVNCSFYVGKDKYLLAERLEINTILVPESYSVAELEAEGICFSIKRKTSEKCVTFSVSIGAILTVRLGKRIIKKIELIVRLYGN